MPFFFLAVGCGRNAPLRTTSEVAVMANSCSKLPVAKHVCEGDDVNHKNWPKVALVYPGDRAARDGMSPQNNRFRHVAEALNAEGVDASQRSITTTS